MEEIFTFDLKTVVSFLVSCPLTYLRFQEQTEKSIAECHGHLHAGLVFSVVHGVAMQA